MEAMVSRGPINGVARQPDIIPNGRHLARRFYVDEILVINTYSGFTTLVISIHTPKADPVAKLGHLDQYHVAFLDFSSRRFLTRFDQYDVNL